MFLKFNIDTEAEFADPLKSLISDSVSYSNLLAFGSYDVLKAKFSSD